MILLMMVGVGGAEARRSGLEGRKGREVDEPETLRVVAETVKSYVGLCHLVVVSPPLHSPLLRQVFKWVACLCSCFLRLLSESDYLVPVLRLMLRVLRDVEGGEIDR